MNPDYHKGFILFSDANNFRLGGCLAQADENGTLKQFSYFSKTLHLPGEKELYSVNQ